MRPERINLESRIAWIIVALLSTAGLVLSLAVLWYGTASGGAGRAGGAIGLVFTVALALLSWSAVIAGPDHLRIDVAAGMLEHVSGKTVTAVPLDELGALTITQYKRLPGPRSAQWFKLEAAGLPKLILHERIGRGPVERLKERLETVVAMSALRRVLASYSTANTETFRAAPELSSQLHEAVPDEVMRRIALGALTRDPDPEIRSRASSAAQPPAT